MIKSHRFLNQLARWIRCISCKLVGHQYRVLRRMNTGARKVGCDRCGAVWGMHDQTRSFVPWDDELEAMYAPGGLLDPNHYSLAGNSDKDKGDWRD